MVTADVRTTHVGVHGSAQKLPRVMPHSLLSSPQVCSWAGTGGYGIVTTGIEGVVHGDLTSLAPHERLPEILVVPREKPPTGAAARGNP